MDVNNDLLIQNIEESITVFKELYAVDDCHIFFSSEEDAQLFCNEQLDLLNIFKSVDLDKIREAARKKAAFDIQSDIPYVIAIEVLTSFKKSLLEKLLKHPSSRMSSTFYEMINAAENCIAQTYLNFELDKLVTFNKIRMASINRLSNTTTLHLYEAHLLWLDQLIYALRTTDAEKMPELHPQKCIVGRWLTSSADEVITDKKVLDEFIALHKNLHFIGKKIQLSFSHKPIDFHILMLLLKKVETLSLSIGIELSIISNIRFQASASKDPLTGTLNRQLLFHIFSTQYEVSRAVEKKFSLIMTDLDDFKFINDTYGHVEGDRVLSSFASMIMHLLRDSDFVIRFGGEEFLLILPTTELDDALKLAEQLKDATHHLHTHNKLEKQISASFGVLEITPDTEAEINEALMAEYIDKVDQALYFAKKNGKDQVSCRGTANLK
jgi:diguanylate cyclase (GGDEF)-like protein